MIKIIHLEIKETKEHYYFGAIKALFESGIDLGVAIDTIYRKKLDEKPYENQKVIIRQGTLVKTIQKSET
ncbi:MAG: hypothetical protein CVU04_04665 [Bacteroidetes bacterium HGW-Bacteroidetes-20]|nr:MAG: hypothetical protein CVU04_04665 [Bacteroidetes bacterium HGW-Bacteroidetes-20]